MSKVLLTDLVRQIGGWPIDLVAVSQLLDLADEVLPDGRECTRPLTDEELVRLGYERES